MKTHLANIVRSRRAFTLVELLVALVVISIMSVAVFGMLAGAAKTSLYVTSGTDTVSQVETAYRRILHNLRACSSISAPLTQQTAAATLTLKTQPDVSNSNTMYDVSYTVSSGSLMETDSRYPSANALVAGVTAFTVTRNTLTKPQTVTVTITAGTSPSISRTVTIYCRDL